VVDGVEKLTKLARAMTAMQLSQHATAGHIEGETQAKLFLRVRCCELAEAYAGTEVWQASSQAAR
jgi:hypothetical protein